MSQQRTILQTQDLSKSFGELRAVDGVSLEVHGNQVTAVIGPNGAGKTTLFNVVTRRTPADRGRVDFDGNDISRETASQIARRGLVRTFQISSVFPALTVWENVLTPVLAAMERTAVAFRPLGVETDAAEHADELLVRLGLQDIAKVECERLAYGDRRRVEVAMALALDPKLLLLDEPTAGMSRSQRRLVAELIRKLVDERVCTIVLTEHDIDLVFDLAERVVVMHQGKVIADGTATEVARDAEVRRAYLGEE